MFNRIVIEALEAWYFGGWEAVGQSHPRIAPNVPQQARYGNPNVVQGGTWEAFVRIMQNQRYFQTRLGKIEAALAIAPNIDPAHSLSRRFTVFHDASAGVTA